MQPIDQRVVTAFAAVSYPNGKVATPRVLGRALARVWWTSDEEHFWEPTFPAES